MGLIRESLDGPNGEVLVLLAATIVLGAAAAPVLALRNGGGRLLAAALAIVFVPVTLAELVFVYYILPIFLIGGWTPVVVMAITGNLVVAVRLAKRGCISPLNL